jgi:hypothetical protein
MICFAAMAHFLTPSCLLLLGTLGQKMAPNYYALTESVKNLAVLLLSSVSKGIKSNIYKCLEKTPSYLLDGSIVLSTIYNIICVTPFELQNAIIDRLRSVTLASHRNRIERFNSSIRNYSSLITLTPQQEHEIVKHYFAQMLLYPQSSICYWFFAMIFQPMEEATNQGWS